MVDELVEYNSTHSFSTRFVTKQMCAWNFKFPVWIIKAIQPESDHPAKALSEN
jgi:hypothetical protein